MCPYKMLEKQMGRVTVLKKNINVTQNQLITMKEKCAWLIRVTYSKPKTQARYINISPPNYRACYGAVLLHVNFVNILK